MKIVLHQTHHTIADFDAIFNTLKKTTEDAVKDNQSAIHLFPELFLTGYPLQDLCLQKSFIVSYHEFLEKINLLSKNLKFTSPTLLLMGGLHYEMDPKTQVPVRIENVIYRLDANSGLKNIYSKILLPNYDIFEEKKYYHPGKEAVILDFNHKKIGLLICEDMWKGSYHEDLDPVKMLKEKNIQCDLIINISASPFNIRKFHKRIKRANEIANELKAPFAYVNRVGGEDEILFDGGSFIVNGKDALEMAPFFKESILECTLPLFINTPENLSNSETDNTFEHLFAPDLEFHLENNIQNKMDLKKTNEYPTLKKLSDQDCEELSLALQFGVQEYASKNGFKDFSIALSGGMDSALVLALTWLSLKPGQSVEAIYMPSEFSSPMSESLSKEMCDLLKISFFILPILEPHQSLKPILKKTFHKDFSGLSDENLQSRLRGLLLYARSNQNNSLVLNTSNKSEIAVGYSTLYGDSVGALSVLGDVYKSEVYQLADYLNRKFKTIIPEGIIHRAPSAELRADQKDSDSLPPYETLDPLLEGILSFRYTASDLISFGFQKETVLKVINLYRKTEYKRAQFCPILKVKGKSFGFGYRVPISKSSDYLL